MEVAAVGRDAEGVDRDVSPRIPLDRDRIAEFCRRWKVTEFAVFGSVLREDFRPDSDIDFLIAFHPDAKWTLLDHVRMERELSELLRESTPNAGGTENPQ